MEAMQRVTATLDVRPMLRGSEKAVVEAVLGRRPGVQRVDLLVAVNALTLKRLPLPQAEAPEGPSRPVRPHPQAATGT
jgi:hypothetical protein